MIIGVPGAFACSYGYTGTDAGAFACVFAGTDNSTNVGHDAGVCACVFFCCFQF